MRGKQIRIAGGAALGLVLLAGVLFWLLRGDDGDAAQQRAGEFLTAWPEDATEEDDDNPAAALTDDPEGAASLMASVTRNLDPEGRDLRVSGESRAVEGGDREVPYTATWNLGPGLPEWSYEATVRLTRVDGDWAVRWDPAVIHPELSEGTTLVRREERPDRAPVLAAGGEELAGVGRVWSLSIWPAQLEDPDAAWEAVEGLDAGVDVEALQARVEEADEDQAVPVVTLRDADYEEHRDAVEAVEGLQTAEGSRTLAFEARGLVGGVDSDTGEGSSGLQALLDAELAGVPTTEVVLADRETGAAVETLAAGEGGGPGEPLRTTIELDVQRAAEEALADQDQDGSIAALRPSTGEILALADQPSDYARSAQGQYAPGSGFKIVTTAALLEGGATAEDVLGCAQFANVDGREFHNQNEFELGDDTTLREAFVRSCNTTFIEHRDQVGDAELIGAAEAFGIGTGWEAGFGAFSGRVPEFDSDTDHAASLIGQGRVEAGPLAMAGVAATVANGEFRVPVLLPDAEPEEPAGGEKLSEETVDTLRTLMRETVTDGTASVLSDVPGTAHAKTGTAEVADGEGEVTTNAWIVGYDADNDLAFAVMLLDGGSGGSHAGPVAAAFLDNLG
ncbi:penicillin-binding transpeptidase domain-containing protein [Streptomyces spiramenti]|uniref:Penicillin-binding protein n=1 Tax=Streptomyces spiramenti TaxID=2720606 RepID=A0ABX1AQC0_9ACTN|nr:penicillin-binding transpeptidase domain-containing protein [Streptomyces spiramenti]NJP67245.1 hypothetical protein [Streptomyces spiramenti]